MVLVAGLVAGALTAFTALRPEASPSDPPTTFAAGPVVNLAVAPAPETVARVGALRVHEAAVAEWVYRRNLPVAASRSTTTPGSFVRPARGALTGEFGEGRRSHRHAGIDFDGNTGDPIFAAGAGTVTHAGAAPSGYSGYGQMVLIDHGNGISTLYAHLSRVRVRVGTVLQPGDDVGAIGMTGNVTGSHLHFELRVGGRPVNPAAWIAR